MLVQGRCLCYQGSHRRVLCAHTVHATYHQGTFGYAKLWHYLSRLGVYSGVELMTRPGLYGWEEEADV